jgi:1-acyl-sn-glycerol-3-phosphate acyltransferase
VKEPVYPLVIRLAKALQMSMGWKVTIRGAENLPATGPVVLAINHSGYLDFVFAAWACVFERKRWVRFLAKKEVFDHKVAGPLMRGMRHIPVDRQKDPARALDLAIDALRRGEVIGTFPEATINQSFVPLKGKTGTVRMAQASRAQIIPVAVWGAHRILTKGRPRNFQRGVVISVDIGPPLEVDPAEDPRVATELLMNAIRDLVDEAQKNYPQQPAGDDDLWWLPAHLGGTAPSPQELEAEVARTDAGRRATGDPKLDGRATAETAAARSTGDALNEVPAVDATAEPAPSDIPD